MTEYERQIGQAALRTMGEIPNIIKCVEELAELQQALCKWMEDPTRDANTRMHVHEELADAQIMINRMGMIFDASLVETWRGVKLDRMARTVGVTVEMDEMRTMSNRARIMADLERLNNHDFYAAFEDARTSSEMDRQMCQDCKEIYGPCPCPDGETECRMSMEEWLDMPSRAKRGKGGNGRGEEKRCETCRNDLGGGYNNCRLNLEAECAAGEFEAWEQRRENE